MLLKVPDTGTSSHFEYIDSQSKGGNCFRPTDHLFTFSVSANQITQNCSGLDRIF